VSRAILTAALCAQLGSAGCLFYPKTDENRFFIRDEPPALRVVRQGDVELAASSHERWVQVRAVLRQLCSEERSRVFERRTHPTLGLSVWGLWVFVLGPIGVGVAAGELGLSGIITLARSDDKETEREARTTTVDCTEPVPGSRVLVLLPSDRALEATTRTDGRALLELPADEPATGAAMVSLVDIETAPLTLPLGGAAVSPSQPLPQAPVEGSACEFVPAMKAYRCSSGLTCREGRCMRE
jgi:hypothetical protein